jgi:hypothetical protein
MTKFAHIVPIPLLDQVLTDKNRTHLCISDLVLSDPGYARYYRNKRRDEGHFVIMDSPAFETGEPVDLQDTLHAERILEPSEVVLPDDLSDGQHTVQISHNARNALVRSGFMGSFMVVPHGDNLDEYIDVARRLLNACDSPFRGSPVLGIQEEIPELYGISRNELMRRMSDTFNRAGRHIQFHLLGIGEHLEELTDTKPCPARSSDTSKFVVYGLNGYRLTPPSELTNLTGTEKHWPKYPGRDSCGGRTGYFYFTPEHDLDHAAITTARTNVANWHEV